MNHVIVLLLCFLLLPGSVQGFRRIRYLDILKEHQEAESSSPLPQHVVNDSDMTETEANDVQELYFTQRLDHYDPSNTNTFRQRYFYTSRYTMPNAENTVTLLCVGGEGPGFDTSVLVDSAHCSGDLLQVASVLFKVYHWNVHVYALEHRYYGKSYPTFDDGTTTSSPVATQNLKYLSSRQALEDLAHFVRSMSKLQQQQKQKQHESPSHGSSSSSRYPNHAWITFGGSYPGYLASLARLKYPHLVHAAVSNSAPLELKVDFPEYLDKLGSDLRYEKIGGSQQCFDIVKNGHYQAVQLLQENATRQALAQQFNVCHPTTTLDDRNNQNLFVGDGLIGIDVQDNDPSCTQDLCNVEKLCGAMVTMFQSTNQTELEILADIARQQRGNGTKMYDEDDDGSSSSNNNDNCVDVDWKATLKALSEPKVTNGGWRSWLWQTCTEVGFYQTCQHETCPYASFYHLVDMDLAICEAAYNITPSQVYSNIQASLDHYGDVTTFAGGHGNQQCNSVGGGGEVASGGGWRRVLTVHGDVDPWGVLGLQPPASTRDMPVKMVEGASHHFWTHAVHETDAPEIERIREYIVMVVLEWLSIDTTTTVSVVDPEHDPSKDDGIPQNS